MRKSILEFSSSILKNKLQNLYKELSNIQDQVSLLEKDVPENAGIRLEKIEEKIKEIDNRLATLELILLPIKPIYNFFKKPK